MVVIVALMAVRNLLKRLLQFWHEGKSTLLRAVTRARPKVAVYPFTTVRPHLGIVSFSDESTLTLADIPGIIPDAHKVMATHDISS